MDWGRDGGTWPNREASRFASVKPHLWHVQEAGRGETILLLHGAGGATQSWRGLLPILAEGAHVVAPDLPGQGFTRLGARLRLGLRPMAEDIAQLCASEGWEPDLIVGHSAGAVLALELARHLSPRGVVGINAALGTFEGVAGWLFPLMAKFMAINPLMPPLLARFAGNERRVAELLEATGSDIGPEGVELYRRLMTDSGHLDGTLAMMSQWHIERFLERLPEVMVPVRLIVGAADGTVDPEVSRRAAKRIPGAELVEIDGRGHLVHEEVPGEVAPLILGFANGQKREA